MNDDTADLDSGTQKDIEQPKPISTKSALKGVGAKKGPKPTRSRRGGFQNKVVNKTARKKG